MNTPPPSTPADRSGLPPCNICGYPAYISRRNLESGKQEWVRMDCLGHIGVPPYLINRAKEHDRMKQAIEFRNRGRV